MQHHAQPFYRRIIADAWHIAWRHKHLWVFGFFATVIGFGAVTDPVFSGGDHVMALLPASMGGDGTDALPGLSTYRAVTLSAPYPLLAFLVSAIMLAFFVMVFVWMTFVSVGALVGSVRKIERGGDPKFSDEVKLGTQKFWQVFGVSVAAELFLFALFMLTAISLSQVMELGGLWRGLFYVGGFVAFTLLAVGASIVSVYATCEVVAKGRRVRDAIETGIELVSTHWLSSLELAFALLVVNILVGVGSVAFAVIASVPFIFMIIVAATVQAKIASTVVVMTAIALAIALIAVVGSFLTTLQTAAWTLFWGDIEAKRHAPPKIIRLARKHLPWLA